jgi:hypothetical protein
MGLRVLKELVILVCCLLAYPALVVAILVFADPIRAARLIAHDGGPALLFPTVGTLLRLFWLKILAPYALVQTIRAYLWSQRSMVGRKWANCYFAFLLGLGALLSFSKFWDLFVFMAALGDIPGELRQLLEIEGQHLLIALVCAVLALNCLRIFLNPMRKPAHPRMLEPR